MEYTPPLSKGVIVGLDAHLEYLLAPFWVNFRLHCDLPVTFFDFGMSAYGLDFCQKRGTLIACESSLFDNHLDHKQTMWFKKPLACSQSPYDITIWLDLDCQVRSSLDSLCETLIDSFELALCLDTGVLTKLPSFFNSGVLVFKRGAPFIKKWIRFSQSQLFNGDQEALSWALHKETSVPMILDKSFNTLYSPEVSLEGHKCHVLHYIALYKELLAGHGLTLETMCSTYKQE